MKKEKTHKRRALLLTFNAFHSVIFFVCFRQKVILIVLQNMAAFPKTSHTLKAVWDFKVFYQRMVIKKKLNELMLCPFRCFTLISS